MRETSAFRPGYFPAGKRGGVKTQSRPSLSPALSQHMGICKAYRPGFICHGYWDGVRPPSQFYQTAIFQNYFPEFRITFQNSEFRIQNSELFSRIQNYFPEFRIIFQNSELFSRITISLFGNPVQSTSDLRSTSKR